MDLVKVLTKSGQILLGKISNFEGEVMEVILNSPNQFKVGEIIKCIYDNIEFESKIMKKSSNHLFLYIPLFKVNIPNNRRKNFRVDVDLTGHLNDHISEVVHKNDPEKAVNIVDLSITGFGFETKDQININSTNYLYFDIDDYKLKAKITIKNERICDNGFRYGGEIQSITKEDFNVLRKYVLTSQLSSDKSNHSNE